MRRIGLVALVTVALLASAAVAFAGNGKAVPGWPSNSAKYTAVSVTNAGTGEVSAKLVREKTPDAVLAQHMKALNGCDWTGLMQQYPDQYEIRMPNGAFAKGRVEAGPLFAGFGTGGAMCGTQFKEISRQQIGGAILVTWQATGTNSFGTIAEPYVGSDAYVTDDGLMVSMVSTFDGAAIKYLP
jgi:hypothetical protein